MDHGIATGARSLRRALVLCAITVLLAGLLAACGASKGPGPAEGATLDLTLEPEAPVVGTSRVTLLLLEPDGKPLAGAEVRIEGNMNHAGMVPVFADASETSPGSYEAELAFTMGGDWFLLVEAEAGGRRFRWKEDVRVFAATDADG